MYSVYIRNTIARVTEQLGERQYVGRVLFRKNNINVKRLRKHTTLRV